MRIKIPKGYHQGQRCFIIGSGPSIKGMDTSWLKDEITICVNQSYKTLNFTPTYICISDENLWPLIKNKYAKMKTKVIACFRDTKKFKKDYPGKNLAVIFRNLGRSKNGNGKFRYDLSSGVYSSRNVIPTVAIPFAYWCKFKTIYLLGCDCNNKGYAYKGGARKNKQVFDDYTLPYYKTIAEHKSLDTTVINATQGGRLEHFPRIDFGILNRKLMVIGFYTNNGDYKERAREMKKSVEQWGIPCIIKRKRSQGTPGMPPKLRWGLNASICPFFIKEKRKKYPNHDLFYLDVDAVMLNRPELFFELPRDYDFGAVFIQNRLGQKEMCAGGLFFAPTKKANELLEKWCQMQTWRNTELKKGIYRLPCLFPLDQVTLQYAVSYISDLKIKQLPPEYGYIVPRMSGNRLVHIMPEVEKPVIKHLQASRTNRKGKKK